MPVIDRKIKWGEKCRTVEHRKGEENRFEICLWVLGLILVIATSVQWSRYDGLRSESTQAAAIGVDLGLYPHENNHIGPVTSHTKFRQSFISPIDELKGIDLFISTYRARITTHYHFLLFDERGTVLRKVRMDVLRIQDNQFFPIPFEPVKGALGRHFSFTVTTTDETPATPITLQKSPPGVFEQGTLQLNGEARKEAIVFRPIRSFGSPLATVRQALRIFFVPIVLLMSLAGMLGFRLYGTRTIYGLIIMIGTFHVAAQSPYSILDEMAHFDYVNAIYKEARLPLISDPVDFTEFKKMTAEIGTPDFQPDPSFPRYEAVQPPLYYLAGAVISFGVSLFTEGAAARFYILRVVGVAFLVVTAHLLRKTHDSLAEQGVIRKNDFLLFALMATFLLSPSFLFVLTPVTNDQLLVPLATFFFYLLVTRSLKDEWTGRNALLLAVVTTAMILTKLTAAYLGVLAAGFFLVRRRFKEALLFTGTVGLLVSPWFAYNRFHYGAWTGVAQHLDFVKPIANPQGEQIPLTHILGNVHQFIIGYLFVPVSHPVVLMMVHFCSLGLAGILVFHLVGAVAGLGPGPVTRRQQKWSMVRWLLLSSLFLNYIYLVFGTSITNVYAVYPRYMYVNIVAAVILSFAFVQQFVSRRYVNIFSVGIIGLWAVSLVHYLKQLI